MKKGSLSKSSRCANNFKTSLQVDRSELIQRKIKAIEEREARCIEINKQFRYELPKEVKEELVKKNIKLKPIAVPSKLISEIEANNNLKPLTFLQLIARTINMIEDNSGTNEIQPKSEEEEVNEKPRKKLQLKVRNKSEVLAGLESTVESVRKGGQISMQPMEFRMPSQRKKSGNSRTTTNLSLNNKPNSSRLVSKVSASKGSNTNRQGQFNGNFETIYEEKENKLSSLALPKIGDMRKAPKTTKHEVSRVVGRLKELKEDKEFRDSLFMVLQDDTTDKESYNLANQIIDAIMKGHNLSQNAFKSTKQQDVLKAKCKKMVAKLSNCIPHELLENIKLSFT